MWNIPFDLAAAQAVAWCDPRGDEADAAGSLRSVRLRPPLLGGRERAVRCLVDQRSYSDAATKAATPLRTVADLRGGRLLIYFPDEELSDGAAEAESAGFFDVYNTPPWDTWIALFGDEQQDNNAFPIYLVSWVPPKLIAVADAGIGVNPEACILWLEDADVPLRADLLARGLIS